MARESLDFCEARVNRRAPRDADEGTNKTGVEVDPKGNGPAWEHWKSLCGSRELSQGCWDTKGGCGRMAEGKGRALKVAFYYTDSQSLVH